MVYPVIVFLYQTDSLLYDLPPEVTLEEVNSFIALEHGQAMLVNVQRADGEVLCRYYCMVTIFIIMIVTSRIFIHFTSFLSVTDLPPIYIYPLTLSFD